ncbi:hypothetical protein BV25DRAFT_487973 [Artomyces pyxidatus]|uniref:Uncharacterized protein n=1 Tax=Artomyces pyxidatus TaxID=48021 RepID=A0ACB8T4C5_9AGAM|nr:hypothetical protein BV25DRAFT_487973 [Artomyces pyxidatus]
MRGLLVVRSFSSRDGARCVHSPFKVDVLRPLHLAEPLGCRHVIPHTPCVQVVVPHAGRAVLIAQARQAPAGWAPFKIHRFALPRRRSPSASRARDSARVDGVHAGGKRRVIALGLVWQTKLQRNCSGASRSEPERAIGEVLGGR